jgi:SAM-dependent methyltransferase
MPRIASTDAYSEKAEALARQYESVSFEDVHGDILDLLPPSPARALDIGAGTGRDAAALFARGYQVTAVEPTPEFRAIGQSLHENATIAWIDDMLPELSAVRGTFDFILISAVWMHLNAEQRAHAMARVAALLREDGLLVVSLRHGPIPEGRIMFEVTVAETVALAEAHSLTKIFSGTRPGRLDQPGVWWDRLAFRAT